MDSTSPLGSRPEYPAPTGAAELRYAGWGYRVAAFLTDAGIALLVAILAALLLAGDDADTQRTVVGLTCVGVWILVTSVAMGIFGGQTVGKRIVGTRVVIEDRPVGFGFSLLRDQILRILYLVPLFFLVDSIWAAADKESGSARPGYTALDRQAFVDSCKDEGAVESYCTCLYDYIAERVPYDTFSSISSEDIDEWPAPMRRATLAGVDRCS